MNQLNNISTKKGRKVFSRRILFFSFYFNSHCFGSWTLVKRTMDQEIKQDNIEKDYHGERKKAVYGTPQKYKRYDRVARNQKAPAFYPVMQTGIKVIMKVTGSIIFTRMCMVITALRDTVLDVRCKTDSDNLIIYGHNINGRRYFGYLQNFREETFLKEYPCFRLLR